MIAAVFAFVLAAAPSEADRAFLLGDFPAAAAAYAREAEAAGSAEVRARARYWAGLALLEAGRPGEAAEALETVARAAAAGPWRARARASLGDALRAAGRLGEAVEAYRAYLVLEPGGELEPWVYLQAARTLGAARRHAEARSFRDEALRRWPAVARLEM